MRQIIHTTPWVSPNSNGGGTGTSRFSSSSSNNNQQRGGGQNNMGLLSIANQRHSGIDDKPLSSSSRTNINPNNESMDSSFEVLNRIPSSSKLQQQNNNNDDGAIHNQSAASRETSWDAVFDNDSEIVGTTRTRSRSRSRNSSSNGNNNNIHTPASSTVGGRYNPKSVPRPSSAVVTPSPSTKSKTMGRHMQRNYLNRTQQQQQQQQQQPEEMTSISAAAASSSADNSRTTTGGGSRISRLASLFSSRAVVASESLAPVPPSSSPTTATTPPSPPRSESSSGYVGWPGTQDKQGATVVAEPSYEESDISGADRLKGYQQEVQKNVDRELTRWMVSDEYLSEESNSPIKTPRVEHDKIHRLAEDKQQHPSSSSPPSKAHHIDNSGINFIQAHDGHGNEISTTNIVTKPQWNDHNHDDNMSDLSTSYSKSSSAYFDPREVQAIQKGHTKQLFGINQNRLGAATVMRRCQSSSEQEQPLQSRQTPHKQPLQSLTEETLAMKDHFSPPPRNYSNNAATVGFRGLLDRTQDVPNLMDDNASECTSAVSAATSQHYENDNDNDDPKTNQYTSSTSAQPPPSSTYYKYKRGILRQKQHVTTIEENCPTTDDDNNNYHSTRDQVDVVSDIFDGISKASFDSQSMKDEDGEVGILGATSRASMEKINLALLGGGLTTIQTTSDDFANRKTASDFDETLTNSDYDQYGFAKIPALHEMVSAGMSHHDRSLSSQSLLFATLPPQKTILERQNYKYYIEGDSRGQYISDHHHSANTPSHIEDEVEDFDFDEYYIHPEEMQILVKKFRKISRSRYPRLDYEDLEKEEDSTKAFALSEMRSRIMEKDIERGLERRGGTTVVDDIVMTSCNKAALRVRDAIIVAKAWRDGATPQDVINTANLTRRSEHCYCIPRFESTTRGVSKYTWEEVKWVDDNELSQYRCHSIGPRHLKGVEMFTIGDCQSILLKLCNERCQELRDELNDATADQIEAEMLMKEEGETENFDEMMTEAEMTYLTSMEAVKLLSQKLVLAEKAFTLVRSRIEKLVAKYESLLVYFENETESVAPSSVFSYESSCYSETYSFAAAAKQREEETLARKAQRAELSAEVVTRESMLARQEVEAIRKEKENELNNLKVRLADLQSEASVALTEKSHSLVLARNITRTNQANRRSTGSGEGGAGGRDKSRLKIDDIKQRFRDRSAAKFQFASSKRSDDDTPKQTSAYKNNDNEDSFRRTVGEEMFQHLDFYERSLKAVKESNQR
jgi:hypothetical protein